MNTPILIIKIIIRSVRWLFKTKFSQWNLIFVFACYTWADHLNPGLIFFPGNYNM